MDYDLAVIGAGWAGFNASLRAKELGLKVALIEKEYLGGTCLNHGCIPTKALIQSAKVYSLIKKSSSFGIDLTNPQVNFLKIQERKDKVIQQLRSGMQFMLKEIDFFNTEAQIVSKQEIKAGEKILRAKFILLATGARPVELKGIKFDGKRVISSDEIINLKNIPQSLLIIGGGVIGCEFAGLFSGLGTKVSVVEKMPQLLPGVDKEVARKLEVIFKKKGIQVNANTDAACVDLNNYELVLLCIGRVAQFDNLGLDKLGLNFEKNRIAVNEYLATGIPNIYAAGDCVGGVMLAHFAAYQGRIAAENMAGGAGFKKADNFNIPSCIFTDPEIAVVGLSEEEAGNKAVEIKVHKFDFLGSGMARIIDEVEGFIKIISDAHSGQILGAAIIGPRASELIAVLTLAVSQRLKISQVKETIFAHPSLSECIHDAVN